jgi:Domain of unknown function (DUF4386)
MKSEQLIGVLLMAGAVGVFIPYTILTVTFEYPDILRQDPGVVLTKFHEGGSSLIFTWWAFAILGLPLLIAYILIGQKLEGRLGYIKWVTTLGVISGVVQIIGLLRWVFVVPVTASNFIAATDAATQAAAKMSFQVIHQLGGVLLGEHIGQLFTIIWTIMLSIAFMKLKMFPKWVSWLGIISSAIYLLAQLDLFATVIPGFPVLDGAGLVGSSLWLLWLIITGWQFIWQAGMRKEK